MIWILRPFARIARALLNRLGYDIRPVEGLRQIDREKRVLDPVILPYVENPEAGPINFAEKIKRVEEGKAFEWPNMVALNKAVASLLAPYKRIAELGGGTGTLAYEAAADSTRKVVCSELDGEAIAWARKNRARPNILYIDQPLTAKHGPFDVVVAVDVIEHIANYREFLEECLRLSPVAVLTTPNKNRNPLAATASPPSYYQHVREWTAGEFYWVLRIFYQSVKLYGMPNVYIPEVVPIRVTDTLTPLIAVCERYYSDPVSLARGK
jgi:2-polyprenyl-3-methyl-5-hydroxy-6-metoxy-1,4-benzoquinol methylase